MTKYKFKAKDLKTGEWVEGDLVYVNQWIYYKDKRIKHNIKPMIVTLKCNGGMIYVRERHLVDESTIKLTIIA